MELKLMLLLLLSASFAASQTLVNIPELGSIQGKTSQTYFTNRTVYSFQGIPYAERPVRFQPPTKKAAWEGVLNATAYGRECPQITQINSTVTGDLEDCLFLDVYTPNASNDSKLPVLFFIHGGGFTQGWSWMASPEFFLEHDMILVSTQYRLGPLGFLSLGIDEIPGNAGMYDQLMALQWVYDNIQYFGGDPEQITISGVSAGATSAALQYVSPLTQGLIKQALIFSGSAVALWSVDTQPVAGGLEIARYAGCEQNDDLVSCLQNVDPLALVAACDAFQAAEGKKGYSPIQGIIPVLDGKFLDAMPLDILKNASFNGRPMIMSVCKHEGHTFETALYGSYFQANNLTEDAFTLKYRIPDILMSYTDQQDTSCTIGTAISEEYFKPEEFGNYTAMRAGIIDYLGSAYFKGPARKMAELNAARGGPTYLVTYDYILSTMAASGVTVVDHGTDQYVLFDTYSFSYSSEDLILVKNVTKMYANFVSTGEPGEESWEPYSLESGKYLVIENPITAKTYFEQEYTVAEREGLFK